MQLPLFEPANQSVQSTDTLLQFSHNNICPQDARVSLEHQYKHLLHQTNRFDRQLVSYQGNKRAILHSWIKYREGFSAQLVENLLQEFGLQPGSKLLEPF